MSSPYNNVLYIGPAHKNYRGGIGSVLSVYAKHIEPFRFVPTNSYGGPFKEAIFFTQAVFKLFFTLLRHREITIVHIHGAKDGSIVRKYFMVFIAKKIFSRKVIFHIHAGGFDEYYKNGKSIYKYLCRFIINNCDKLVVLSSRWDNFFAENFKVNNKLKVLINPIEPKQISNAPARNSSETVFLFLGRIADHKGVFELIDLIIKEQALLRGKCKFLFGGNHEVELLQSKIAEAGIGDIAEYIGWAEDEIKESSFLKCDYFILPTHEEGMPMTILESLSYGKPVITTDVGAIPEVIKDGKNGYLFEAKNMTQLKSILFNVINDKSKYDEMSQYALKSASNYYPENIKTELEKLYSEIS
jgi:glycosyltransferase involved in cell wall biosynthesis